MGDFLCIFVMEGEEITNFLLHKNSIILVDFTNTITAFSEAVLHHYYLQYNPKRKKKFEELTHISSIVELNFSTREYDAIKSIYLQVIHLMY